MKHTGIIKWFNEPKGYGFIYEEGQDGQLIEQDIFVHYTAIKCEGFQTLSEGERVSFEKIIGPKGAQALNIEKVTS